ncbi:hypothetical protein F4678DRAFT_458229 [Xylaria arbuscula]|nr:hypothetical protein F4678DRAFT_458229 [Xylaria arbuscula]
MERPLICTSLRKRLDWASLPAALLQSHSLCGKWKETQLDTHDLAIPLTTQRVFRAIFMSPRDIASDSCSSRIERLYSLNAGQDSGILFLLKHDDEQQSAVHALMKLQLQLVGRWELPIIPINSVAAVPGTLVTIQSRLPSPTANRKPPSPASHLLPFCSDGVPLAEHTVNILTDTTSGFSDLLEKLSSSAEFESEIVQLLGNDADKFLNFWANDYLVD